ncbi:MAG TPA: type II toxin-antitoxin system RelE/ParE family toxin [Chlorobaculum parvum]|uniref:Type II toxin-antitoxin system RelE/ParE family toxin n=1 Tax=Chlorobaculum parvum TaxID=274539 RepID=A0A7C5HRA3_9CHLB|nr:type II toxin-antitoxin system RelE/ParE family toxin [Chlorobaculum parvum]
MKFYFHELAESEFDKAVDFYEDCQSGLGLEFAEEVYATIALIVRFPEAWSPMSNNSRRCLVNRFPSGVIYQVKSDGVRIIAVADLRRRPDYWLNRE